MMLKNYVKNLRVLNIKDYINNNIILILSVFIIKDLKYLKIKNINLMKKSLIKYFFIKEKFSGGLVYFYLNNNDINYQFLNKYLDILNINYILYKKYNYIIKKNDILNIYINNFLFYFLYKFNLQNFINFNIILLNFLIRFNKIFRFKSLI